MPDLVWKRPRQQLITYTHEDFFPEHNVTGSYSLKQVATREGNKSWVRTPNWKLVRREAKLPMNPYFWQQVTASIAGYRSDYIIWRLDNGSLYREYEDRWDGPTDIALMPANVTPLGSSTADARARNKTLDGVKNSTVNLGQVFGERAQTVLLLETTIKRVVRTVVYLRKGNWNAAANEVGMKPSRSRHKRHAKRHSVNPEQATAQGWLELQYGWRPLLQDIYGSLEFVNNKWQRILKQKVTKSASDTDTPFRPPIQEGRITWLTEQKRKTTVKYTLFYSVPEEFLKTLSEAGVTNPALVAWELMPWSFVVDWFLPVGQFISTWDATIGLSFDGGVKTTISEVWDNVTGVGSVETYSPSGSTYTVRTTQNRKYHFVGLQRTPIGGFPAIALPQFKSPLGWEHAANFTALLLTTFRR